MAKIRLSPLALSDLKEIKEYITDELCNPIAANRIVTEILFWFLPQQFCCLEKSTGKNYDVTPKS